MPSVHPPLHAVQDMPVSGAYQSPFPLEAWLAWSVAMVLAVLNCASAMQAIEFVQMQRDDELWELLISLALSDADMTGGSIFWIPHIVCMLQL